MRYFARIRYVGTDFCGFQVQKNSRTVQGTLNAATEKLFGCPCMITGCSRTDSGVHAEEFCLTITPTEASARAIPPHALPAAILPYLPPDVSLYYASEAPEGFHPRHDALGKEYRYRIRYGALPDPFLAGRVWQVPYRLSDSDFSRMQAAAPHFIGKHDFTAFMCTAADVTDCVRTIQALTLSREGNNVTVSVTADGFLYNMVRIITGTLFEIGRGNRTVESVSEAIRSKSRPLAGMTAPPDGLYLHKVFYPDELLVLLDGNARNEE